MKYTERQTTSNTRLVLRQSLIKLKLLNLVKFHLKTCRFQSLIGNFNNLQIESTKYKSYAVDKIV